MEIIQGKLSNYIGQFKENNKQDGLMSVVDKDLQNLWKIVNDLVSFFPGSIYADINIGSISLGTAASAPGNVTISSTNIVLRGFDGNVTTEQLYGVVEIPHSYKEGTNIIPHIHWMPSTSSASNVKWQMEYFITKKSGGSAVSTATALVANSSTSGIAWEGIYANFNEISGTNLTIGSQLAFRLFRDPTDLSDTYPDDAVVETIGFHYRLDTIGSSTQQVK